MTDERMMELLKRAVEHIESFEEDESENVFKALGFTEEELAEIRFETVLEDSARKLTEDSLENKIRAVHQMQTDSSQKKDVNINQMTR